MGELVRSEGSARDVYTASRALFPEVQRDLLTKDRPEEDEEDEDDEAPGEAELPRLDPLNTVSYCELCGYMANTLLRDTDVMSMAHALEVRVPLIDHRVVEFVAAVPGSHKLARSSVRKPLLVEALGDLLPAEVRGQRKMGFTLPFERWLRGPLQGFAQDRLSDRPALETAGLNPDQCLRLWKAYQGGAAETTWSRVWALCVASYWSRQYLC